MLLICLTNNSNMVIKSLPLLLQPPNFTEFLLRWWSFNAINNGVNMRLVASLKINGHLKQKIDWSLMQAAWSKKRGLYSANIKFRSLNVSIFKKNEAQASLLTLVFWPRYRSTGPVPISAVFTWVILGGGQINTYQIPAELPPETPPRFGTAQVDCKSLTSMSHCGFIFSEPGHRWSYFPAVLLYRSLTRFALASLPTPWRLEPFLTGSFTKGLSLSNFQPMFPAPQLI